MYLLMTETETKNEWKEEKEQKTRELSFHVASVVRCNKLQLSEKKSEQVFL